MGVGRNVGRKPGPGVRRLERKEALRKIARSHAGALLFSLPLVMTMEMWQLGFSTDGFRLALFLVLDLAALLFLDRYMTHVAHRAWATHLENALIAFAAGYLTSAAVLVLIGVLASGMPVEEIVGKLSVQAAPASLGALLARSQFGGEGPRAEGRKMESMYWSELFIMGMGALFFAYNVAPTEEMLLINYRMSGWHRIGLAAASLVLIHAIVFSVGFRGQERWPEKMTGTVVFFHFSVSGYAVALLVSLYVLWTFGRLEGESLGSVAGLAVVLGFPASLGAGAARLLL